MAPNAQYWEHCPHPMHWAGSMLANPDSGSFEIAGQPSPVHMPHALQSAFTKK